MAILVYCVNGTASEFEVEEKDVKEDDDHYLSILKDGKQIGRFVAGYWTHWEEVNSSRLLVHKQQKLPVQ